MLRVRPLLPVLLCALIAAGGGVVMPASAQDDAKLPSVDTLLEKMVEAIGGEQAIRKHKSRITKGTQEMPAMNFSSNYVTHSAAPNRQVRKVETPGLGTVASGFDGEIAWRDDPQGGARILEGPPRDSAVLRADFYADLHFRERYTDIQVKARKEFNGKQCFELHLVDPSGEENLYLDAETYLIEGRIRRQNTPNGPFESTVIYEDYKEFDGWKIATVTRSIYSSQEQLLTISEVTFDSVDESAFELPNSIKALLKK